MDGDLNQKPVPRLAVDFARPGNPTVLLSIRTGFDGIAAAELPPGMYRLTTPKGVAYQGRHYSWQLDFNAGTTVIVLSNDNAKVSVFEAETSSPPTDDVAAVLARLRSTLAKAGSAADASTGAGAVPPTSGQSQPAPAPTQVARKLAPIPDLVAQLSSKEPHLRSQATEDLVATGDPSVSALGAALVSSDPQVRGRAAFALGRIKSDEARKLEPTLRKMADSDGSGFVRERCVEALKNMGFRYGAPR